MGLLSVALLFSYMNDTHRDLPRCLFPRVRARCLRWLQSLGSKRMLGGLLSVALLLSYMNDTHGDLPRCLFPGFGLGVCIGLPKGLVYTLPHD